MEQYLPIFTLLVLAVLFAALSFVASRLLAPSKPTSAKEAPYESGIIPTFEPPQRFPVRFYVVAMLFIVFDIEIIFLYPWAVTFRSFGLYGLIAMTVFAGMVFISLLYEIAMGGLEWGPVRRGRPVSPAPSARTTSSTVRRIGKGEAA